jgi:superfamily II RNA helicase
VKPDQLPVWNEDDLEPIHSRINISFNLVVNLLGRFTANEIETLLARTLASFQERSKSPRESSQSRSFRGLMADFNAKWAMLQLLGYVDGTRLLPRGRICRRIYVQEILITELIAGGLIKELEPWDLAGLAAAIVHSPRSGAPSFSLSPLKWMAAVDLVRERLKKADPNGLMVPSSLYPPIAPAITAWAQGASLSSILKKHPLDPGDLVSVCRQSIDLLRQIITAIGEEANQYRIGEAIAMLDRGVVRVNMG